MNQNHKQDEDWWNEQKAMFAVPRPDLIRYSFDKTYVRTCGKRCPWCHDVFYTYHVEGHEKEPYKVDPEPTPGFPDGCSTNHIDARETCGHPLCWKSEAEHQAKRREEWRKLHLRSSEQPTPEPKKRGY